MNSECKACAIQAARGNNLQYTWTLMLEDKWLSQISSTYSYYGQWGKKLSSYLCTQASRQSSNHFRNRQFNPYYIISLNTVDIIQNHSWEQNSLALHFIYSCEGIIRNQKRIHISRSTSLYIYWLWYPNALWIIGNYLWNLYPPLEGPHRPSSPNVSFVLYLQSSYFWQLWNSIICVAKDHSHISIVSDIPNIQLQSGFDKLFCF